MVRLDPVQLLPVLNFPSLELRPVGLLQGEQFSVLFLGELLEGKGVVADLGAVGGGGVVVVGILVVRIDVVVIVIALGCGVIHFTLFVAV